MTVGPKTGSTTPITVSTPPEIISATMTPSTLAPGRRRPHVERESHTIANGGFRLKASISPKSVLCNIRETRTTGPWMSRYIFTAESASAANFSLATGIPAAEDSLRFVLCNLGRVGNVWADSAGGSSDGHAIDLPNWVMPPWREPPTMDHRSMDSPFSRRCELTQQKSCS